ncbi:MAG: DeoR/GlpR transcriptional regulator [Lachnospiraceae bacterium]|jgi:DeoR family fructose operon transcriptional repressor|nr:DeoR/GlpR transcriptional regulator [Lachnospiraceae bacterium]
MVPELRQEAILASVRSRDISYIKDLAEELNISLSTIRRDIAALEEAGTVISMRGGAVKPVIAEEPAPAAVTEEAPVVKKRLIRSAEKDLIAKKAAALVSDGDVIYIDSGTTCSCMFQYLSTKDIIIVTSNYEVLDFMPMQKAKVIMLGGEISNDLHSINGPLTEKSIADMHFNKAFIGANGYIPDGGVFTHTEREARKKVLVKEHSDKNYLLMDTSKKNQYAFQKLFNVRDVELITEE